MKTSFVTIASIILGAVAVTASLGPQPTPHLQHAKRQQFPDGINLSAMLANPSSYMKGVSSALHDSRYGSEWASGYASKATDSAFKASLSKEIKEQFGAKTAAAAMAQYTKVAAKLGAAAASSSSTTEEAAQSVNAAVSGNNADVASASSSSTSVSSSGNVLNATSGATLVDVQAFVVAFAAAMAIAVVAL